MVKLTDTFYSLFNKTNKAKPKGMEDQEGVIESFSELDLTLDDEELLTLAKTWETLYNSSATKSRIHDDGNINEKYWLGRQYPDTEYENGKRPLTDNIIFEATETMIPLATQQNPEAIVLCENKALADKINKTLTYLADYNCLKTKLKKGVRHWTMRYVGCWKVGYDGIDNEIIVQTKNPKKLILDPNAPIEDGEYKGEFLGELMSDSAKDLIIRFPKKEKEITALVGKNMGALINYTQWWTNEYVFYRLKGIILGKYKNPHWNYDTTQPTIDDFGQTIDQVFKGKNHFTVPKMPYVFLTCFDLGDEPADKTSLISQSLVSQDNINKRLKQIDRNADNINGGIVVSELAFNKEQASQVGQARREGRTIVVPNNINDAIMFPQMQNLPNALFDSLNDQRGRLLSRFGSAGSTAQEGEEKTVRGKIIEGNQDSSRIGGGVSEYLEVASSRIFNYWLQMVYVYYDTPHLISAIGQQNAVEMIQLSANDVADEKIVVKVQNGSMIPQDELSAYNEAIDLWTGGAIDPLSLYEKLKDPNPQEKALKLMLFKNDPAGYMQQFLGQAPMQMGMEQGGGQVAGAEQTQEPEQQQESQIINSVPMGGI